MCTTRHLEFWTDSFHEGEWAAKSLSSHWKLIDVEFLSGFIPKYTYEAADSLITLTIFGSYRSWSPLPEPIEQLLEWGKPDLIVFDADSRKILFSAEETAATPTGNQAMQRCERAYGSARGGIPFVYLLGEFGTHKDGGLRRDSIWPTLQAVALTLQKGTPVTVLHYGERETPDSYDVGNGFSSMSRTLWLVLRRWLGEEISAELEAEMRAQYQRMLAFVKSQWPEQVYFLPNAEIYDDQAGVVSDALAKRAAGEAPTPLLSELIAWPLTAQLGRALRDKQAPLDFYVRDPLLERISTLIERGKCYVLTGNAGSKPQSRESLRKQIELQRTLFLSDSGVSVNSFRLKIEHFPKTSNGAYHVLTANKILFLIDNLGDFVASLGSAFGEEVTAPFDRREFGRPVFLFVCNSLKPGRIFGDPYVGQIAAQVPIFARNIDGTKNRYAIAYFPHQAHTQLLSRAQDSKKGVRIMKDLLDYAVFHSGVSIRIANIV